MKIKLFLAVLCAFVWSHVFGQTPNQDAEESYSCSLSVSVSGSMECSFPTPVAFFSAHASGGSGNYSYRWIGDGAANASGNQTFISGFNSAGACVEVTDNVTGCKKQAHDSVSCFAGNVSEDTDQSQEDIQKK